jgi:protein SCO1/2
MHCRPISVSDLGHAVPLGIAIALALVLSQPLVRAGNSPVTIGGPFALTAPDGTMVSEQTYSGKWLLVSDSAPRDFRRAQEARPRR